ATATAPPADQPDPGPHARPRKRLVRVLLAPTTPVPGPAMSLPAARPCPRLNAPSSAPKADGNRARRNVKARSGPAPSAASQWYEGMFSQAGFGSSTAGEGADGHPVR